MTVYGRTYTPPVFHVEKADNAQLRVMQIVFDTLEDSGIDFCVVERIGNNAEQLYIKYSGDFSEDEKNEIVSEVAEMYFDNEIIRHISIGGV